MIEYLTASPIDPTRSHDHHGHLSTEEIRHRKEKGGQIALPKPLPPFPSQSPQYCSAQMNIPGDWHYPGAAFPVSKDLVAIWFRIRREEQIS